MFKAVYLALALIFAAGLCNAGEVVYYDEDGKPIHKRKYIDLNRSGKPKSTKKMNTGSRSFHPKRINTEDRSMMPTAIKSTISVHPNPMPRHRRHPIKRPHARWSMINTGAPCSTRMAT